MLRQQLKYIMLILRSKKLHALTHKRLDGCWKPNYRVPTVSLWMVDYVIR